MVYESEFYTTRRPYSSSVRPTISSYTLTSPIRVVSPFLRSYSSSAYNSFVNRAPIRFSYNTEYTEVPYHGYKRILPVPMTRITTSPSRVYREQYSPIRVITPSARIYRRDVNSPVRVITSPARIVNIRVRPSTLSREFDRIEHKYRSSPLGFKDDYINTSYSSDFRDATSKIRASSKKLLQEIHEPVPRAQSVSRFGRAQSLQPTYSRFDPDLIDKFGNQLIENEFYVNKNILRPTRKTRDHIEILSNIKYREPARRYTAYLGLDPARASRKFNEQKEMQDPAEARKELAELKAANRLTKVKEVDEDLDKIKQKRIEERRLREEQALMEEKVKKEEQAKREEADRQAEIQRQERLAAQAASERQAEIERKAAEEARLADEARELEAKRLAEENRKAAEAQALLDAAAAEEQRKADEAAAAVAAAAAAAAAEAKAAEEAAAAKAAEEAAAKAAEEEAARVAEEARLAELESIKAEEIKLAELEKLAKEDEEVELARQANELAELARQQTEELQNGEPIVEEAAADEAVVEEPVIEEAAAEEPVVEAPESPLPEDSPIVEESIAEPVVEVAEE